MRALAATAALFAAAASLAACSSSIDKVGGEAAPVTATATTPAITAPATTAPAATATGASPSKAPTSADTKKGACPVSNATLYAALKADKQMWERVADPTGLQDATCADGYATAMSIAGNVDPAGILFKYDTAKSAWKPLNLGSGGYCEGYVSASLAARLGNGC
jgi:hypothetical protein